MITSIVLTDTHKVGLDSYGRFMVGEEKVSIKEVPFVRYRFDKFDDAELDYIGHMKKTFKHSSHMVEINISENTPQILDSIEDKLDNIIRYIYVPVTDENVTDGFTDEIIEMIEAIEDYDFDRIMLKDNSTTLYNIAASRLKGEIADILDIKASDIGVCQSPLSFGGDACLTAVKARELSAEYAENDEVALPSANHECMKNCGCIRYNVIDSDVAAPVTKNNKRKKKKQANNGEKQEDKTDANGGKVSKSKGLPFIQF